LIHPARPGHRPRVSTPLLQLELPGIRRLRSTKVRELFDLGDALLIVATDRVTAFDCVLPNGVPRKGEVLTQISHFWCEMFERLVPNHLLAKANDPLPGSLRPFNSLLERRSMVVRKAEPLPIECVVRGHLSGSAWREYQRSESVCGIRLPPGLTESAPLPEPVFTPATKAEVGHDENVSFEQMTALVGRGIAEEARRLSLEIYAAARAYARDRGIIIADTKLEFGLCGGRLILIDEVLTPDSSRFWPADQYEAGQGQPSFDKQYLRDYLERTRWNKQPPAPELPPFVVQRTQEKYFEAFTRLTGRSL
jgi:phosphoribosylaminoimidazole-succinocarboxamide synthase